AAGRRIRLGSGLRASRFTLGEPRPDLLEHLLIRLAELGSLGRCRLGFTFYVPELVEEDLDRTKVGGSRAIDELGNNRLEFADLAASAVLGHGDGLVEGLFEQRGEMLGSARPASRIAGLALGETGMPRRLAIADLVVPPLFTRHRRPPRRR